MGRSRRSKSSSRKSSNTALARNNSEPGLSIPTTTQNPRELAKYLIAEEHKLQAKFHSGPIPDAEEIKAYGEVDASFPNRILRMAEDQGTHRRSLEQYVVVHNARIAYLGVFCALLISIFTIGSGSVLIFYDHDIAGTILSGSGLVGLVSTFIYGTKTRKEEREEKDVNNKQLTKRK